MTSTPSLFLRAWTSFTGRSHAHPCLGTGRDNTVETVGQRNWLKRVACTPFDRDQQCQLTNSDLSVVEVRFVRIFAAATWLRSRAQGEAVWMQR